jgi:hypothetical protein
MTYVETDCTFEIQGRTFEAGGAVVTPNYIVAYPAKNNALHDWHGNRIGHWYSVASWPVNSYMGERMHQIEADVKGVTYTGRGFGENMIYKGKRKAGQ